MMLASGSNKLYRVRREWGGKEATERLFASREMNTDISRG